MQLISANYILHEEMYKIKEEKAGCPVSIIFDGTMHVCEAMVIILRFTGETGNYNSVFVA